MNSIKTGVDKIVKAGIFDEKWYVTQYPDVSASGLSPAEHYLKYGVRLRRKPNPTYDAQTFQSYQSSDLGERQGMQHTTEIISCAKFLPDILISELKKPAENSPESLVARQREAMLNVGLDQEVAQTCSSLTQEIKQENLANRFLVSQLKLKLWGGFSRYAVDGLEEVKNDCRRNTIERAEAAYSLMQWFYVAENYSRAYENVLLYGMLSDAFLDKNFVIGSSLCLIKLERYREANELIDTALDDRTRSAIYLSDYLFLKAAIVRQLNPGQQGENEQLVILSNAFKSMGLAPLEKQYPELSFNFGNLTAQASARITEFKQKVSIIIPAFNAAASISFVIKSLQSQTWKNIEIIVVDDCSLDNTVDVVKEIMAYDRRVKLICKLINEGAYPARNTGLNEATGDMIMVHDSDDWSHPQKLEIQVRALNKTPGAVASMSNWIRVDEEFMPAVHSRPRNTIKSLSFPSLLFKREIIDQIGPWAAVRVSGDAEFKTRIERYYGKNAIARISKVLSISLSREGSLTQNSATHINTLHFGVRWQYLNLYEYFHSRQLKHDPECEKCLAVSTAVVGNRSKRSQTAEIFDYIFISDFVSDVTLIKYIVSACAIGAKVAVYHWRNFEEDADLPLCRSLYEACIQHRIALLTCNDTVDAKLVIVGNFEILRYRQDRFPAISSSHVIGLLQKKSQLISPAFNLDMLRMAKTTIKIMFGREMRLVSSSQRLSACFHAYGLQSELDGEPLPPAIDTLFWCDREIKASMPRTRPIEIIYPSSAGPDIALGEHSYGNVEYAPGQPPNVLHGSCEEMQLNYKEAAIRNLSIFEVKEKISAADFYLYFPNNDDYDHYSSGIYEALALGVPVILPFELEPYFGEAALYANHAGLKTLVTEVWNDQFRYSTCAQKGRNFVQTNFAPSRFYDRMQRLLD